MTQRRHRGGAGRTYTQAEVDALMLATRADQQAHDVKGNQQQRIAAEHFAAKLPAATPQQRLSMFQTIIAIIASIAGLGMLALLGINTYAGFQVQGQQVQSRLVAVETWRTEMQAAGLPAEIRELKGLSRTRDLQIAEIKDQIQVLRNSDSTSALQNTQILSQNAALAAQVEDVRRQLGELRSLLGRGAYIPPQRQSAPMEEPAVWRLPHYGA